MDRTLREIDHAAACARREGKVSKDDYDWFAKHYRKLNEEEGKRQRQEGTADESRQEVGTRGC